MQAAPEARASVCPACGAGFGCGAGTGSCWCVEVEVPEVRLGELAERHDGCLCPRCLAKLEQRSITDIT